MNDQKNTLLFIVLSALILFGWQMFYGLPQMEKSKQQQQQTTTPTTPTTTTPGTTPGTTPPGEPAPTTTPMTRDEALALSPRIRIESPRIGGSIALKGGRIDDVALVKYRETVNPSSPPIYLLSPTGTGDPFYAEFGWVGAAGTKVPDANTTWTQQGSGTLTTDKPVTLTWDNGEGLTFRRTISVDANYLFTIKDEVANAGAAPALATSSLMVKR